MSIFYSDVSENGTLGPETELDDEWSIDADLETEEVDVCVYRKDGKEEKITLTGDQHRDLENGAGYEALFEKVLKGDTLESAVESEMSAPNKNHKS